MIEIAPAEDGTDGERATASIRLARFTNVSTVFAGCTSDPRRIPYRSPRRMARVSPPARSGPHRRSGWSLVRIREPTSGRAGLGPGPGKPIPTVGGSACSRDLSIRLVSGGARFRSPFRRKNVIISSAGESRSARKRERRPRIRIGIAVMGDRVRTCRSTRVIEETAEPSGPDLGIAPSDIFDESARPTSRFRRPRVGRASIPRRGIDPEVNGLVRRPA